MCQLNSGLKKLVSKTNLLTVYDFAVLRVNCDPDKSGIWENLFSVWSEFIKVMNRHFIPLQTFKSFPQDVFPIFLCGFYVVVAREVQDGGAKCWYWYTGLGGNTRQNFHMLWWVDAHEESRQPKAASLKLSGKFFCRHSAYHVSLLVMSPLTTVSRS